MSPKLRVQITPQQKLEYAKMRVEDGYTNQHISPFNLKMQVSKSESYP